MNQIEIFITQTNTDLNDILIAELSNIGFDGFEEVEEGLKAFTQEFTFNEGSLFLIIFPRNASALYLF